MQRVYVQIIKDKNIHLKINSTILDQIKKKAAEKGHFLGDYINQILLEHLNDSGSALEMELDKSSHTNVETEDEK
jgi:hypothetical protein